MSEDARLIRVLIVCMGNICRSPMAHGVLRQRLQDRGLLDRVDVDSAGTHGYHVGEPPDERAQAAARSPSATGPFASRRAGPSALPGTIASGVSDMPGTRARILSDVPAETLDWLLEPENPAVAVLTRRTLLGEAEDDDATAALWARRTETEAGNLI